MRAVIQRVSQASVSVNEKKVTSINEGLLVLVGLFIDDSEADMKYIINKIMHARIFDDGDKFMNLSVTDIKGEILIVSQFTLYGDLRKGRRPSYSRAMPPDKAKIFYEEFIEMFKKHFPRISSGIFGAHMDVSLVNSGPVTILLESDKSF